jgi:hypothetical protein
MTTTVCIARSEATATRGAHEGEGSGGLEALTIYRVKALEARPGGDLFLAFGAGFDRWPGVGCVLRTASARIWRSSAFVFGSSRVKLDF